MGLDHHRVSAAVSGALSGPGGAGLLITVFAGLPGVTTPPRGAACSPAPPNGSRSATGATNSAPTVVCAQRI